MLCRLFCSSFGCGSAAFLLDTNLIQDESQAGNGSQEGAEHLSNQSILAGQFAEAIQFSSGQDRTFHDAALDGQGLQLVLLGELANDTSGSDGIASGDSHSGSAVQNLREIVASILSCEIGQSVLNNGVLNTSVTELLTQFGILSDSNTLVVDENDGSSLLDLARQGGNNCLLALKNLCVGHGFFTSEK